MTINDHTNLHPPAAQRNHSTDPLIHYGNIRARNLNGLNRTGRQPAPCACGQTFLLYPHEDLPQHGCRFVPKYKRRVE